LILVTIAGSDAEQQNGDVDTSHPLRHSILQLERESSHPGESSKVSEPGSHWSWCVVQRPVYQHTGSLLGCFCTVSVTARMRVVAITESRVDGDTPLIGASRFGMSMRSPMSGIAQMVT